MKDWEEKDVKKRWQKKEKKRNIQINHAKEEDREKEKLIKEGNVWRMKQKW